MKDETLPAKRLEHATSKLQDALSALKLAGEELAIVEASMIGDDAHRKQAIPATTGAALAQGQVTTTGG